MTFTSAYHWLTESTLRTLAGLSVISLVIMGGYRITHAANSYDVANEVQMYLDTSITTIQTTGIVLSTPVLNGSTFTFSTTTGGILRLTNGTFREDIHYNSATVNSSTKKVTLVGVTRNICAQYTRTFVSCGNGRSWSKGTIVQLTQDARLFNLKLNQDRVNNLTGSGQISGTGTGQAIVNLPCITSTQRDNMTNVRNGDVVCNSTLGTFQYRSSNAWISFGSGSTINATTTVGGKVELATVADVSGSIIIGDSGSPLVIPTSLIIRSSTGGLSARNKIPATNNLGYLSGSLLGSGTRNSTTFLRGDGQFAVPTFTQTYCDKTVYLNSTPSSGVGKSSTSENIFQGFRYVIATGSLINNVHYEYTLNGSGSWAAGTLKIRTKLNGATIGSSVVTPADSNNWVYRGELFGTTTAGASAKVYGFANMQYSYTTNAKTGTELETGSGSVNTVADPVITFTEQLDSNNASNNFYIRSASIRVTSTSCTQ